MKNVVITGDSLSVSRYSYCDTRGFEAWNYNAGMGCWSFRIRNKVITSAPDFTYACDLKIKESAVCGADSYDPMDAIFGNKVRTVTPEKGEINIEAKVSGKKVTLYLQSRFMNYCRFNVYVDGVLKKENINTYSDLDYYNGMGLITLEMDCCESSEAHHICLKDFECVNEPKVTVAGVSGEAHYADVTGRGSQTTRFLLYHFGERIAKYTPDTMVLILGGNDCLEYGPEQYRQNLDELFGRTREINPECKLVAITIPPTAHLDREILGKVYETDEVWQERVEEYNLQMEEIAQKYGAQLIKLKDVFAGIDPVMWRYDNVHFTAYGNELVYNAVDKVLFG